MSVFFKAFQKGILFFLIIILSVGFVMPSLGEEGSTDQIVEPTLPPNSPEYDSNHPEDLISDQIYAHSAIVIEAKSGDVIFAKDSDRLMHPASTTKILTVFLGALMGAQQELMDTRVYCSERAADVPEDSSLIPLIPGEDIIFKDLLFATMIRSGNEGANIIAESTTGSIESFVDTMNEYVRALGLTNTHFSNTHGFPEETHYSTVHDMAMITRHALENDLFREIARSTEYQLPPSALDSRTKTLTQSRYPFMRDPESKYYYPYAIGVKTGTSSSSGYCFVGAAQKEGITLISVVFHSGLYNRWSDTIKLLDYGFSQYQSTSPIELYEANPISVNVSGYALTDKELGVLPLDIIPENADENPTLIVSKQAYESMVASFKDTALIQYEKDLQAPISAGEAIATLYYFPEGEEPVTYQLVASRSIAKRENAPKTLDEIIAETEADPNPFPPFTFEIFLILVVCLLILFFIIRGLLRLIGKIPKKRTKLPKRHTRRYH